jgi:hypothetical protein
MDFTIYDTKASEPNDLDEPPLFSIHIYKPITRNFVPVKSSLSALNHSFQLSSRESHIPPCILTEKVDIRLSLVQNAPLRRECQLGDS